MRERDQLALHIRQHCSHENGSIPMHLDYLTIPVSTSIASSERWARRHFCLFEFSTYTGMNNVVDIFLSLENRRLLWREKMSS